MGSGQSIPWKGVEPMWMNPGSAGFWMGHLPCRWSSPRQLPGSSQRLLLLAEVSWAPSQAADVSSLLATERRGIEGGVGTMHTHLIQPVASLGDMFRVEKSWETSLCGPDGLEAHAWHT